MKMIDFRGMHPILGVKGSFLPSDSCFSSLCSKQTPDVFYLNNLACMGQKLGKKAHFLIWPIPNSTLDGARGHFCLQNLVSRLKWTHEVFYMKNLACIGQKLEKKSPFFNLPYPQLNPGWGQGSFLPSASCSSLKLGSLSILHEEPILACT